MCHFFSRFSKEGSGHGLWTSGNKMSANPPPDMSGHPPSRRHVLHHEQYNLLILKLSNAKMIYQTCPNNTTGPVKDSQTLLKLFVKNSESHQSLYSRVIFSRYSLWPPLCLTVPSDRTVTGRIEKY